MRFLWWLWWSLSLTLGVEAHTTSFSFRERFLRIGESLIYATTVSGVSE